MCVHINLANKQTKQREEGGKKERNKNRVGENVMLWRSKVRPEQSLRMSFGAYFFMRSLLHERECGGRGAMAGVPVYAPARAGEAASGNW